MRYVQTCTIPFFRTILKARLIKRFTRKNDDASISLSFGRVTPSDPLWAGVMSNVLSVLNEDIKEQLKQALGGEGVYKKYFVPVKFEKCFGRRGGYVTLRRISLLRQSRTQLHIFLRDLGHELQRQ